MSIQGTLEEVKTVLENYVDGFISGGKDFEGMICRGTLPQSF